MAFQITVKEVTVESVVKGKSRYQVANVAYEYKGEPRTQKLVSFSNPDVFAKVQTLKAGDVVSVETAKNDKGYDQWAKITTGDAAPAAAAGGGRVTGSNYETPQERADNRVRIVRQSSISNAIATLAAQKLEFTADDVLELAQEYFDWVYESADDTDKADQ